MCIGRDRVHQPRLDPVLQPHPLPEAAVQHSRTVDLAAQPVLLMQAGQQAVLRKAGIPLNVGHQNAVTRTRDLPQGRFQLLCRYVRHKFQQHPAGISQGQQLALDCRISRRRGIQQLRAVLQLQVVAFLCAVCAGQRQMPVVDFLREAFHARRTVRGSKQVPHTVCCRCIQHGIHFFSGLRTIVHAVDEVRMIIRKAAHFFSASWLRL